MGRFSYKNQCFVYSPSLPSERRETLCVFLCFGRDQGVPQKKPEWIKGTAGGSVLF